MVSPLSLWERVRVRKIKKTALREGGLFWLTCDYVCLVHICARAVKTKKLPTFFGKWAWYDGYEAKQTG